MRYLLAILLLGFNLAYADEIISSYDNSTLPVLNEQLKKLRKDVREFTDTNTDIYVKSDSADTSAGYLSAKVDNDTIKVNTTSHKLYTANLSNYSQYSDTAYFIGNITEKLVGANPNTTVTGLGFTPRIINLYTSGLNTSVISSNGYDDGVKHYCIYSGSATGFLNSSMYVANATYNYKGNVTSINNDGFNISWIGSDVAANLTVQIVYNAYR